MADLRTGSCLCGAARYEINLDGHETGSCHCTDCQRHHGAPFAIFSSVDIGQFRWIVKPEGEARASKRAIRRFCRECGTPITWEGHDYPDRMTISTTTIENPDNIEITYEIFTKSRLPSISPISGARQFEEED